MARTSPSRGRGTDDYLTARAANPRTGLITPFTPAPINDLSVTNPFEFISHPSSPTSSSNSRQQKSALPRSPDLEFDLGSRKKGIGAHRRGLSGLKWLDRLKRESTPSDSLRGHGVKVGHPDLGKVLHGGMREEIQHARSTPLRRSPDKTRDVRMQSPEVRNEGPGSPTAEEDMLRFYSVPRSERKTSPLGAGKDLYFTQTTIIDSTHDNGSRPYSPRVRYEQQVMPLTTSIVNDKPTNTNNRRSVSLPVLSTQLHFTLPTTPSPEPRSPFSFAASTIPRRIPRKPVSPTSPYARKRPSKDISVPTRPQPRPLQQQCRVSSQRIEHDTDDDATCRSMPSPLRHLPSIHLLPPHLAGRPRPHTRVCSSLSPIYRDGRTTSIPRAEQRGNHPSQQIPTLLTTLLPLLSMLLSTTPSNLSAIPSLFDGKAAPSARLLGLHQALAASGRALVVFLGLCCAWRVLRIVAEVGREVRTVISWTWWVVRWVLWR